MKKLIFLVLILGFRISFAQQLPAVVTCSEPYQDIYKVPNFERIPRYIQAESAEFVNGEKTGGRDSNLCFASAAAQMIDVFRFHIESRRGPVENFIPTSPLLMGARFHYVLGTPEHQVGGSSEAVIEQALRFGTCGTLVPQSEFHDNVFSVSQELTALQRSAGSPGISMTETFFAETHRLFFLNSYQQCQPTPGNGPGAQTRYGTRTFDTAGGAVSDEVWNRAITAARNNSNGIQALGLSICAEVLEGRPFVIATDKEHAGSCSSHAITMLGKRCRCGDDCEVLVRDSYRRENPHQVNSNDFWISEQLLRSATTSLVVIDSAEQIRTEMPASK